MPTQNGLCLDDYVCVQSQLDIGRKATAKYSKNLDVILNNISICSLGVEMY